jgi:hypothetical protein
VKLYRRTGVLCVVLCFALGIANIFSGILILPFSIICLYVAPHPKPQRRPSHQGKTTLTPPSHHSISSFIIIFIEIPLLLRICPTSATFDNFIRRFETNYMRAAIYGVMSLVQWLSLITHVVTSLIAAAVVLLVAAAMYLLAGVKGQQFQSSKTLGGQGVAQMIV